MFSSFIQNGRMKIMKESSIIVCPNCGNARHFYNEVMKRTEQFLESIGGGGDSDEILLVREDKFENKNGPYVCSICHSQTIILPSKLFSKQQIRALLGAEDAMQNIKIIEEIAEKERGKGAHYV